MMEAGAASIRLSDFFFLSPLKAGQSHLTVLLPFSPLSFPRKRESSARKPVTRPWIPACAGMTATERSENPNTIALPLKGGVGEKSGAATTALNHR